MSEQVGQPQTEITEQHPEAMIYLTPGEMRFRQEGHRLQMQRHGEEEWRDVQVFRLLPLSQPERWLSVCDKEGKEIGILQTLHGMDHHNLGCLRKELHRRYMIPEIQRIVSCRDRFDLTEWSVETDRGHINFLMRHPHENIKQTISGRYTMTDVEGNRYDIPDMAALDHESQAYLELRM